MAAVLLLTNSSDGVHTDVVADKIVESGSSVIRLDTDQVSHGNHSLEWEPGGAIKLTTASGEYNLLDVDSVWFRRPKVFDFAVGDPVQRAHTENEFQAFLSGIYAILESKRWLNAPQAMERARLKSYQLKLARDVGLLVPDSIITARPEVARQFCAQGQAVFKPLSEANISNDGRPLLIPTTLLTDKHLERLDLIRNQYVLLQRFIAKQYELRITFVAGELFVAKQTPVDAQGQSVTDWRLLQINGGSTYEPSGVGRSLGRKVSEMMRKLNLNFATLDFAVDSEGAHYFLEVNPNGQWYGYTDEIGMPASTAIAKFLIYP